MLSRGGLIFMNANPLLPLMTSTIQSALEDTAVTLEIEINEEIPLTLHDESHMEHVFMHLTNNAIEAMPEGGLLKIYGQTRSINEKNEFAPKAGDYIHPKFSDSGVGIPAENLPQIFDPYYSTKKLGPQKGTGLGLALCNTIIRKHNGIITAESEPDQGTTIHIYLPAAAPSEQTTTDAENDQLSLKL